MNRADAAALEARILAVLRQHGRDATYVIRNRLFERRDVATSVVLRRLKALERRGLVVRAQSYATMIVWALAPAAAAGKEAAHA
jgi:DNA-binding MarR family transcriptional regulator